MLLISFPQYHVHRTFVIVGDCDSDEPASLIIFRSITGISVSRSLSHTQGTYCRMQRSDKDLRIWSPLLLTYLQ